MVERLPVVVVGGGEVVLLVVELPESGEHPRLGARVAGPSCGGERDLMGASRRTRYEWRTARTATQR